MRVSAPRPRKAGRSERKWTAPWDNLSCLGGCQSITNFVQSGAKLEWFHVLPVLHVKDSAF